MSKKDTVIIITNKTDIEALFKQARSMGGSADNDQARRICQKILEKKPEYYEVRIFLGRTFAWEKDYENARTELGKVLIEKENDLDALSALIDVETWSGNYDVAMDYLKLALGQYPSSEVLLLQKAKLQIRQENKDYAALTLRRILEINPGNKVALNMMISLENDRLNNTLLVEYDADFYDRDYKPQQALWGQLGRSFRFGSVMMRGTAADRFGYRGAQYEVESYIHFTKSSYADIVMGTSQSRLFPDMNYSCEIYQRLFPGTELSAGIRYLQYPNFSPTIYTFSVNNYIRSYLIIARMYMTTRPKDTITDAPFSVNSSKTYLFKVRRYLEDADHFVGIKVGYGQSPDDRRYYNQLITKLTSYSVDLEIQRRAFGKCYINADAVYARQEMRKDAFYQRITMNVQLKTYF